MNSWSEPGLIALMVILVIWSSVWKGFALYRAGSNRSPIWFVVLFLVNTLGILEILYLFIWGKKRAII
jgi:methionyl-tRNA synthetase